MIVIHTLLNNMPKITQNASISLTKNINIILNLHKHITASVETQEAHGLVQIAFILICLISNFYFGTIKIIKIILIF